MFRKKIQFFKKVKCCVPQRTQTVALWTPKSFFFATIAEDIAEWFKLTLNIPIVSNINQPMLQTTPN